MEKKLNKYHGDVIHFLSNDKHTRTQSWNVSFAIEEAFWNVIHTF